MPLETAQDRWNLALTGAQLARSAPVPAARISPAMRRLRDALRRVAREVTVHVPPATATASAPPPGVAMSTRMLLHWADVAIEQERLARAARRQLEQEVEEAKATGKGLNLTLELRPSLIAIAAVTHALDALYGELRDIALPAHVAAKWRENPRSGPPRQRKLLEALKHGFSIRSGTWQTKLDELFDLRDAAVHPETLFRATEPHPLGVSTAQEYVAYRCETATEAIDLLFEILETCGSKQKPALNPWAGDLRPSLERLKKARSSTTT
jgi:hypothetical protein